MTFTNKKFDKITPKKIKHPYFPKTNLMKNDVFTGSAFISIKEGSDTFVFQNKKAEKIFKKALKKLIKKDAYANDVFKDTLGKFYKKGDFKYNFKVLKIYGIQNFFFMYNSVDLVENGGFFYKPLKLLFEDSEEYTLFRYSYIDESFIFLIKA